MKCRQFGLWVALCMAVMVVPLTAVAQEEEAEDSAPDIGSRYVDLKPAFIVNYGGPGRLRYLKTDIALRVSGGTSGPSAIRHHMPYIRHQLVMLLSRATEEQLSSMEGKEMLRQQALAAVQQVLLREEGEQYVHDLLFNSFIVQR